MDKKTEESKKEKLLKTKNMLEKINQYYENEQRIYFSLLEQLDSNANMYTRTISKNMFKISMKDQIQLLQLMVLINEKNKELCEKYKFDLLEECEEE